MDFKKTILAFGLAAASTFAAISYEPVTAGATDGAKKLYNFLATNYGAKTVSGIMIGALDEGYDSTKYDNNTVTKIEDTYDFAAMIDYSGKAPALVGFDFMNATGKSAEVNKDAWFKAYTETAVNLAEDLWKKGGIPAFTWHWRDPSDSTDAFYCTKASAGDDNEFTLFDFTKGFVSGTTQWDVNSETYKRMVQDIDIIADYFLQLQEKGVAAIFRPLHEASGGWFWWGTKGGEAFKALYKLVHDEMVNVKGVKNLVWVWNGENAKDKEWNPGAENYDVISLDIYEAWDYTKKFVDDYNEMVLNYGNDKILAISENGPIPDASAMHDNNTVYSWWMPWYQSWSGNFLDQTHKNVWKANMEDECTITLDEMPGWDSYTISSTQVPACTPSYKLADLDITEEKVVEFPSDTATNGWLMVEMTAAPGDTANGNVVIKEGKVNLEGAKTVTLEVHNKNKSGFWFTIAFLGNQANNWAWAQPDGCWINAGEITTCTIDLSTTAKDEKILSDAEYADFIKNISKLYIEIFANNFSGTVFFDDVKTDNGIVLNNFDNQNAKISVEQEKNMEKPKIIGSGTTAIKPMAVAASKLSVSGNRVMLNAKTAGMVSVDVFGMNGKRVTTLYKGTLSAGTHAFDMADLAKGQYIVRVKGAGIAATKPVIIK